MDCATFCRQHAGFVDGVMPDVDLVAMQRHVAECEACAARDVAVRRALVVLRNLPAIDPSPDFTERLRGRLRQVRSERRRTLWSARAPFGGPGIVTFAGMASGVIAAGFIIVSTFGWGTPMSSLILAPVVASAPMTVAPMVAMASHPVAARPPAASFARIMGVGNPAFGRGMYMVRLSAPAGPNIGSMVSSGVPVWSEPPPMVRSTAPQLELTNLRR
jgi:hypothetical protein